MLSVIIPTRNSERTLVPTLAMLVPGAVTGTVREVIIADGGSTDATAEVAELAGCAFIGSEAPLAARLRSAVKAARSPWLLFLRSGIVLDPTWVEETARCIEGAVARGSSEGSAAVFRRIRAHEPGRSPVREIAALLSAELSGPHPDQGLMISRPHYERLGGHRDAVADPEQDLLSRIGRRHITRLQTGAANQFN
jgi:glycosyltransferase involved in cell wall biosynthesis